jgi:hypothetical protein
MDNREADPIKCDEQNLEEILCNYCGIITSKTLTNHYFSCELKIRFNEVV